MRNAAAVVLVATVAAVAAIVADGGTLGRTVPSGWDRTTLTCLVVRIEQAPRVTERFRCRIAGDGLLPTGRFRSPDINWDSDIDQRRALATDLRITSSGVLTGWAAY